MNYSSLILLAFIGVPVSADDDWNPKRQEFKNGEFGSVTDKILCKMGRITENNLKEIQECTREGMENQIAVLGSKLDTMVELLEKIMINTHDPYRNKRNRRLESVDDSTSNILETPEEITVYFLFGMITSILLLLLCNIFFQKWRKCGSCSGSDATIRKCKTEELESLLDTQPEFVVKRQYSQKRLVFGEHGMVQRSWKLLPLLPNLARRRESKERESSCDTQPEVVVKRQYSQKRLGLGEQGMVQRSWKRLPSV